MVRQIGEHVGEPSLGIDSIELARVYEREHGGCPIYALVRAHEGPTVAPDGNDTDFTFCGIVGHAQSPVVEEAGAYPAVD